MQALCSCELSEAIAKRFFLCGGGSETPCLARSSTFGSVGPQVCPLGGEEEMRDWANLGVSQSAEEKEAEMFSLISGFAVRMHKQAASA